MLKIGLLLVCTGLWLNAEVLCDKIKLTPKEITSSIYRDCEQVEIHLSKDEKLAYKVPHDNCSIFDKKEKREAINRLKEKNEYLGSIKVSSMMNLASSVPDYESWSSKEIKAYQEAKKAILE